MGLTMTAATTHDAVGESLIYTYVLKKSLMAQADFVTVRHEDGVTQQSEFEYQPPSTPGLVGALPNAVMNSVCTRSGHQLPTLHV